MNDETPRPGSAEGRAEMQHWSHESRIMNAHRDWLIAQARIHVPDAARRQECVAWLRNSRRSLKDAEQLAKRWGLTLPPID